MRKIDMSIIDALPDAESAAWETINPSTGEVPELSRDDVWNCARRFNALLAAIKNLSEIGEDVNVDGKGQYDPDDLMPEIERVTHCARNLMSSFDTRDVDYVLRIVRGDIVFE